MFELMLFFALLDDVEFELFACDVANVCEKNVDVVDFDACETREVAIWRFSWIWRFSSSSIWVINSFKKTSIFDLFVCVDVDVETMKTKDEFDFMRADVNSLKRLLFFHSTLKKRRMLSFLSIIR